MSRTVAQVGETHAGEGPCKKAAIVILADRKTKNDQGAYWTA